MKKLIIISKCDDCPFFDNEYYGYAETCTKMGRAVPDGPPDYDYPIPDWCPLESTDLPATM